MRLLLFTCRVEKSGLVGVGRLEDPACGLDVSIARSCLMNFRASKIFSPSESVVKE